MDRIEAERPVLAERVVAFNMDTWMEERPECGFSACAIGTAALHPWFIQRGLTIDREEYGEPTPRYRDHYEFDAISAFFGIEHAEAILLFGGRPEEAAHTVTARIREFVEGKQPLPRRHAEEHP